MANVYTASTDVTTLPKFYHKTFLERLSPGPKMMDFCIKKPLEQGAGTTIYFPRVNNFSTTVSAAKLTQGTIKDTEKFHDAQVSAIVEQFGQPIAITDITALTAINGTVEEVTKALADQANNVLDQRIMQAAYGTSATPWLGSTHFSCWAYNTVGASDTGASTSALYTYAGTTEFRLKASTVRAALAKLQARNVQPFDDGMYALVAHSDSVARLKADSEFQNAYVYTDAEAVRKGTAYQYEGVKIIRDNNITTSANGSNGVTLYYSILLGRGGLGATELDGGVNFYTTPATADKADPLAQFITVGWKSNFIPKVLNVSCGLIVVTADTT